MKWSSTQWWDSSHPNVDVCNVHVFPLELVKKTKGRKNFLGRTQPKIQTYFRCYSTSLNSHLWDWSFLINSNFLPEVSFMKQTFIASLFVTTGDKETTPQILLQATAGAVCRTSDQVHQHQLLLDPKYSTSYCQLNGCKPRAWNTNRQ